MRDFVKFLADMGASIPPGTYTPEEYEYVKSKECSPPIAATNTGFKQLKRNELSKMIKEYER